MNISRIKAIAYKEWREILRDRLFFTMAFLLNLFLKLIIPTQQQINRNQNFGLGIVAGGQFFPARQGPLYGNAQIMAGKNILM